MSLKHFFFALNFDPCVQLKDIKSDWHGQGISSIVFAFHHFHRVPGDSSITKVKSDVPLGYGGFHKWGYPNSWLVSWNILSKWMITGVFPFWETSIWVKVCNPSWDVS